MQELLEKIAQEFGTFTTDSNLQLEKVTKLQVQELEKQL